MKANQIIKFLGFKCLLEKGQYPNGRIALELVEINTGEPVLVASINMANEYLSEDEVIIKNYSENEGILDILIKAQIISEPTRFVNTGWTTSPVCKLLN